MTTPRSNWLIAALFLLICTAVFVAALISPQFRGYAYAPLRELFMPPPKPVVISLLYSTEKEAWLDEALEGFYDSNPLVDGRPVHIDMEKMGSREIYLAVLDGTRLPTLISPASSLQIAILQELSSNALGQPLVNLADSVACRPVVRTPLVLVAWRERAELLWGGQPGAQMWQDLHDASLDPHGWDTFGHPEWGYFKFGHTNPLSSNSGFMTILLMTDSYFGGIDRVSAADLLSDTGFQEWFLEIERSLSQFEYSTGPLMEKMVAYGPSTYDMVAVYEATAIEQAENAVGRYGDLRMYYPPATVWSDHPFCVLQGDWVTEQQAQAASLFIDYLLSKEAQELALLKYGFRPVDASIPLDQPGSPFTRYAANGFQADLSNLPVIDVPKGDLLNILLEFWARNIER
jgi:hypothetical protein